MRSPAPSRVQRFLGAVLPPLPPGVWVGLFLVLSFGSGVIVGMMLCVYTSTQALQRFVPPAP